MGVSEEATMRAADACSSVAADNSGSGEVRQEATMCAADACHPVPNDATSGVKVGEEASSTAAMDVAEDVLPPARASCESSKQESMAISAAPGIGSDRAVSPQSDGNKAHHRGWAADSQAAQRRQELLESLRRRNSSGKSLRTSEVFA